MESVVQRLSQSLAQAQSLEELTRPMLQMLEEATQLASTYLTTVDEAKGVQQVLFARNAQQMQIPEGLVVPWGDTLCKRAIDEGRMYTPDVGQCWGDSEAARELGIRTYASAPVRFSDGRLYGTLCAASDKPMPVGLEAQSMLSLFAKILSERLEREQLIVTLKQRNQELAAMALLDPLTGVPNRRCLTEELQRLIARCARSQEWVVVGFVDMDHFKRVNDVYGHDAGDALLCAMSERLTASVRSSDMLARFGGDEFVLIGVGPLLGDDADAVACDLQQRLTAASAFQLDLPDGRSLDYSGASVGVVCLRADATDAGDALQKADAAMYRVKLARTGAKGQSALH
ncbi:sensor domain-containing diguanylate cyclase [Delftia sp. PS-11]|uniref:sensor domain-containing diguanylate cyclase n=1 Tax=Delftia sp. PS-11 TaxID=2767222 RepID=UPI002457B024|nr:sensor domain-containing diguanylate cyclase [Delftia sp. PS-11]KAJ8746487.1 sensor domain-containing diguanylate cyclase [Delftia sp. PS-11]